MPRRSAIAAYALVCALALAGGFVAGAIHAATERSAPSTVVGLPLGDAHAGTGVPTDARATPSVP